jgi:hypothetical protein
VFTTEIPRLYGSDEPFLFYIDLEGCWWLLMLDCW